MMKSILIKAGMLMVTAVLVAWIGWPMQGPIFIDESLDTTPENSARPQVVASSVSPNAPGRPTVSKPRRSRSVDTKPAATASKLDINRATMEEFRTLPGVGDVLAQRMIERRTVHGPYRTVDDLRDVKGIGAKRLEKLRPLVVVKTAKESSRTTKWIESAQDAQKGQPTRPQAKSKPEA